MVGGKVYLYNKGIITDGHPQNTSGIHAIEEILLLQTVAPRRQLIHLGWGLYYPAVI
jgi:hypothetical protein